MVGEAELRQSKMHLRNSEKLAQYLYSVHIDPTKFEMSSQTYLYTANQCACKYY